jgi:ribosomal protein L40E
MNTRLTWGSLLIVAALLALSPAASLADRLDEAPNPDAKCLKCHSKNLKKKLEDGEKMSLRVEVAKFEESAHGTIGCTGCHEDITKAKHPGKRPISSARDYSLAQNENCRRCHSARFEAYEGSIHASLAGSGNPAAPLCSDCHEAHAVQTMAVYEPVTGEPCKSCHDDIYQAYSSSVHVQAPICADCHHAHDVTAAAAGDHLKNTCIGCHDGARLAHEVWLPNAGMHLDAISCPVCHSPMAEKRVDLQLYDKLEQTPVGLNGEREDLRDRLAAIDADGDGLDPIELWKLVRRAGLEGTSTEVVLRGRMEVAGGADAHRIAPRSNAVRSCESCHQGDAEAFQNVTVSISRQDGRRQRLEANPEVLSSAISVDSVGGFYAPGGTRIKLLDGLLMLSIFGALAIPVGHVTLGKIIGTQTRKSQDDRSDN